MPFPVTTDEEALDFLKKMAPIQIEQEYKITYLHSYGQDSPWFAGLANKHLLASRDPRSGYVYANPRGHDMYSGEESKWVLLSVCSACSTAPKAGMAVPNSWAVPGMGGRPAREISRLLLATMIEPRQPE